MKKIISKKRTIFVEMIAALLLIFFIHNAISNFINLRSLKNLLQFYTRNYDSTAWAIVIAEIAIVLLLLIPRTRLIGFVAVILIASLACFVVINNPYLPHHFGGILTRFSTTQHIAFYSLLGAVSIAGICVTTIATKPKQSEPPSAVFT